MRRKVILIYDGTFNGLLSCIFSSFEEKLDVLDIQISGNSQPGIFSETEEIITDPKKAVRVWKALKKKTSQSGPNNFYRAFLSELPGIEIKLLRLSEYIFNSNTPVDNDFSNENALFIDQTARKVGREKHRMEAFVRFQLTKDQIYFSNIEPDFNVIPLIVKHFKDRYADQQWIIYDLKRKYGIFYNQEEVTYIHLEIDKKRRKTDWMDTSEMEFQQLWQNYFKSVNIQSRINTKLHVQHVPKRYWKYLTEKTVLPD